jgi:hypothetical protein
MKIAERLKRLPLPCNLFSFFRPCRVNRTPVHDARPIPVQLDGAGRRGRLLHTPFGLRRRLLRSIRSSNSEYNAVQFRI